MSNQFVGEIRMVGFNFAPTGWAFCDGQILPISQYTALFSLLGTQFGGNGTSDFALPNLQGNMPMHSGEGAGLSQRVIGETGGEPSVTLLATELPTHSHAANCVSDMGDQYVPTGYIWATDAGGNNEYNSAGADNMAPDALENTGGSQSHNNMPPYLVINFIIAMNGIFPSRS